MQSLASLFLGLQPPSSSKESIIPQNNIRIGPLRREDLEEADRIFRLAFGTFLGIPDPEKFCEDVDYVRPRWTANPKAALKAEIEGKVVGSNFVANWGSVGFFGPLSVHPDFWERGVAQALLEETMKIFDQWGTKHAGLFTFAHSPKHLHLYQKFGFFPRYLTAILCKRVDVKILRPNGNRFSEWNLNEQEHFLRLCRALSDEIYSGLDLTYEIQTVLDQKLGETLLLWENGGLTGFAVCHVGEGTEAGGGVCYIKFGAVRPGARADQNFKNLLELCESFAAEKNLQILQAGINLGRSKACSLMKKFGFRAVIQGVALHRPNEEGYHHPQAYVIDDWR